MRMNEIGRRLSLSYPDPPPEGWQWVDCSVCQDATVKARRACSNCSRTGKVLKNG